MLICLGDQLSPHSPLLRQGSKAEDTVWMAELAEESTHVWSHKSRIVLFLSAMRHHANALRHKGWQVRYLALDSHGSENLAEAWKWNWRKNGTIRCAW